MGLNTIVCIKPVPDPDHYDKVSIDFETKRITRVGIPTIINPVDKCAIEIALKLREAFGGKVTVITMSMPSAEANLREALAMGADEGILLTDIAFGGADTLATSYTLAEGIKKAGDYDLVLAGNESADGATAQMSSQLGVWLDMPHLWNVCKIEAINSKNFCLHSKYEDGTIHWEGRLPLVLGVSREVAKPRYIGAINLIKAKNKPIHIWSRADLPNADDKYLGMSGSPTKAGNIKSPDLKRAASRIEGDLDEIAKFIVEKIRANVAKTI